LVKFRKPRNLVAVRVEVIERPLRPGHCEPQTFFRAAAFGGIFSTLVEGHHDVGA
jgi:hypothetical protein